VGGGGCRALSPPTLRGLRVEGFAKPVSNLEGDTASVEQHPVEMIVMKQVASYLATPIFVVDPIGNLLYYNEPAERILGLRYDETGEMPQEEWTKIFIPTTATGEAMPPQDLPLVVAVEQRRPANADFHIVGFDGVRRLISVVAFPLIAQSGRMLGAVALFWSEDA
jgi:PAS domain-containing protein